eukprot:CAMPEP_0173155680 /NCGR_PEP_ID=MMETSP1105-20130129/14258_1 /TAXON_ID=2985 /ORGANISM="Ochromonas sp., Strain BG-1" /LENGTH=598 /DNA_ID=CAMNT_0014072169 /DNA_START=279 /DNA_END=2075 /DNA_ORIENTATION=-
MSEKKLTVSGFATCSAYQQAKNALLGMKAIYPKEFDITVNEFATRDEYMEWLPSFRETIDAPNHKTSPIVWFEGGKYLGGRDDTIAWVKNLLTRTEEPPSTPPNVDPWNPNHGFDYDLVVIGGGSGGLACGKEAVKNGAKVACLDYVKPSPHGSKWGLGGTCVNVGCIPKKLMHMGAQLGEHAKVAKSYGWTGFENGTNNWDELRDHIQDHIKGLNFGYRVQLREQGVTYLNKLGKFKGPNTLECIDSKGKVQVITAARFVIATGGRPTPINIPGGEYAITSDDLFSLDKPPGKTCVVGAGYVALECGGFIAGLGLGEVVILVRSRPLRTFDQDTVKYVLDYMKQEGGIRIEEGILPKSIEKLSNGRYLVHYGDKSEEFDTVLAAIGRTPDLSKLGIENLSSPLTIHKSSGKIIATNERTSIPNIYALGDVLHDAPELTPSAILAGKLLARRLFGNSTDTISYRNIATAVFTPLELGTVGFSEEDAITEYGKDAIECFISEFKPLEWSISDVHHDVNSFVKIVVLKESSNGIKNKVIGLHIAAPNAGEVIQGYGLAMNKGLTYEELTSMVGIHPTVGEEFTYVTISKSSGQSIAKAGC